MPERNQFFLWEVFPKALRCEITETDDDDNDDDDDLPTHQWGGGCAPLSRRKASGSTNTFITGEQRSI